MKPSSPWHAAKPLASLLGRLAFEILRGGLELADFVLSPRKKPKMSSIEMNIANAQARLWLCRCFGLIPGASLEEVQPGAERLRLETIMDRSGRSWQEIIEGNFEKPIREVLACWKP